METYKMPVDAGLVNIEVCDGDVVIGSFKFNPSDADIVNRYREVGERLKAIELPKEVKSDDVARVVEELKELTNFLLCGDVADEIYSVCSPLSVTTSGDFYFEVILDGVANVVEKVTKKRLDKKNAKIAKATAKYKKA